MALYLEVLILILTDSHLAAKPFQSQLEAITQWIQQNHTILEKQRWESETTQVECSLPEIPNQSAD